MDRNSVDRKYGPNMDQEIRSECVPFSFLQKCIKQDESHV